LILAVILITFLGQILSSSGNFKNTFLLISSKIKNIKYAISIIPALIGLIPMPGGALFSAPIVDEGGKLISLDQNEKHNINYIFRHLWEFFWPTYPAILLISNFFNIGIKKIINNQIIYSLIYTITALLIFIISIKKIKIDINHKTTDNKNNFKKFNINNLFIFQFFKFFWPIILLLLTLIIFEININIIVSIILILFFIINKFTFNRIIIEFKKSFSLPNLLTIISILIFKELISNSKVLDNLPVVLSNLNVPDVLIAFFSPFLIGFLTGLTVASVGISFPILKSFYFVNNFINYPLIMISLIAGFWGVMLSPVHLCLSLTKDYFKTSFNEIYPKLIIFFILNLILSILLYLINFPPIIKI
jgi:hypothetical protein